MRRTAQRPSKLSPGLLLLLAAIGALGSMAIHMFVPAIPSVARDLRAEPGTIQLAVTLYLIGIGAGQLAAGTLADGLGRRPVMLAGLVLFMPDPSRRTRAACRRAAPRAPRAVLIRRRGPFGGWQIIFGQSASRRRPASALNLVPCWVKPGSRSRGRSRSCTLRACCKFLLPLLARQRVPQLRSTFSVLFPLIGQYGLRPRGRQCYFLCRVQYCQPPLSSGARTPGRHADRPRHSLAGGTVCSRASTG
jgi:hypothetical protein